MKKLTKNQYAEIDKELKSHGYLHELHRDYSLPLSFNTIRDSAIDECLERIKDMSNAK